MRYTARTAGGGAAGAARWAAAAGLALAGFFQASPAQEIAFQQWPADAVGASYRFEAADPRLSQTLDYQSYQDMVRASIGSTGLVEARDTAAARFTVAFRYGTERTQVTMAQPRDPYFNPYFGYSRWPYGHGWGGGGGYYGGVGYYSDSWVPVQVETYRNTLTVEIRDAQRGGATVYTSTAASVGNADSLRQTMPYLTQALFEEFPANNGQSREISMRGNR